MQYVESSLEYRIAPYDEQRDDLRPTLVLLHGRGANEDDLLGLVPYLSPRFLFIAARAPFAFPFGGVTWYDLQEIGSPNGDQFAESYERLVRFLNDIQKHYPVDPRQTFLLGFSMGTVMCYSLALTMPERIRGVVAHSGYVPEASSLEFQWGNLGQTSFFVAHGIYDPVIPISFGRRANELLAKTNAPLEYREYPIQHEMSDESLHDLSGWLVKHLDAAA